MTVEINNFKHFLMVKGFVFRSVGCLHAVHDLIVTASAENNDNYDITMRHGARESSLT